MSTHTTLVDAAYEGVQKRTFLAMAIMIGLLPILVTLMLLYPKLGKLRDKQIAAANSLGTEPNNDKCFPNVVDPALNYLGAGLLSGHVIVLDINFMQARKVHFVYK